MHRVQDNKQHHFVFVELNVLSYFLQKSIENRYWMSTMQTWNNLSGLLVTIKFEPGTATNTATITSNMIITAQNGMTDNRTYLLQQMTMTATTIRRNSSKMISKGMRTLISLGPGKKEKERKDVYVPKPGINCNKYWWIITIKFKVVARENKYRTHR